jgi:hemerythrin
MEYVWDASVATGHEIIDEQHKELFRAINELMRVINESEQGKVPVEKLQKSMSFLSDYTIKHFFDEERIQQKYGYPDYVNHKKYHDDFKLTVKELSHQLILQGPSESLAKEVQAKIGDWLVSHIKAQDIRLGAYIKQEETGTKG